MVFIAKRAIKIYLIIVTLTSLIVLSCNNPAIPQKDPNPSSNPVVAKINAKVSWSGDSVSKAPTFIRPISNRGVSRSSETLTALESNYANLGSLRKSLTPTVFKLPIQALEVATADSYLLPVPFHTFDEATSTWICQYADFTTPLAATPEGQILAGKYLTFFMFFFTNPGSMLMGSNNRYLYFTPAIEVDLGNEYAGVFPNVRAWPVEIDANNPGYPSEPLSRADLGGGQYRYTLHPLLPKNIEMVLFGGTDYDAIVNGLEGSYEGNLLGYKETPGMESTWVNGLVRIPWKGFTISADAATVEFVVSWDLADIIEVYDASTPDDLSDDKVVLANRWWERISLKVLQKNAAGNPL